MPRLQPVIRTRNLLREQARITIFLACHHVVSVTAMEMAALRSDEALEILKAETYLCPFCPDPEPEPVTREEMSPRRLWRDAGEPIS